ncbi:hypothetical protein [Roseicyclus persicicus]|uniref:Uncharacterized protein n=1 Tax=Roseicyclus persicicus TaxID=2650661 RepID=A0A7X6JYA0_9RHOB|nr:hypothetical protein [Roseibacterium persicicum]NKX43870.1 hypothetical protein [Roseibacterium persicicum]
MPVRRLLSLCLSLALAAGPAAGDTAVATLRAALAAMPRGAVAAPPGTPLQVEFGEPARMGPVLDVHLAHGGTLDLPQVGVALGRALPAEMRNYVEVLTGDGLAAATGLTPGDIGSILSVSAPPERLVMAWIAPGAAGRMVAALEATGHAVDPRGPVTVLSRGADFAVDFALRDPANPFGGSLGQSSRFAVAEGVMAWAPATPLLAPVLAGQGPSLADHPGLQALLAGVDAAAVGAGGLVYALALVDGPSPDLLVADLVTGDTETGLLALAAPDTAAAEAMATLIRRNWAGRASPAAGRPFADLMPGEITVTAHPGTPAAVTLRRTLPRGADDPLWRNAAADGVLRLVMTRDLDALLAP